MATSLTFLDQPLHLLDKQEVDTEIANATKENQFQLATVNPEFLLEAKHNAGFRKSLSTFSCCIDGFGLYSLLGFHNLTHHKSWHLEMYPGATLVENLFSTYSQGQKSFYLLGGSEAMMQSSVKTIQTNYPHLKIVGAESGGKIILDNLKIDPQLARRIRMASPDILLVGFGAPKQELWIEQAKELGIPVMIGIGGTLEFYSNRRRAPGWIQKLHLEWLYRSFSERGHWKRAFRAVFVFTFQALYWSITHS